VSPPADFLTQKIYTPQGVDNCPGPQKRHLLTQRRLLKENTEPDTIKQGNSQEKYCSIFNKTAFLAKVEFSSIRKEPIQNERYYQHYQRQPKEKPDR
jgi:hypothetical protein